MSVPQVSKPRTRAEAPPRTGAAMAVIMTGVLMTAVDTTIVVLALPEIQRGLHVAFTSGLHAAFYTSMGFMVLASVLSALRAGPAGRRG